MINISSSSRAFHSKFRAKNCFGVWTHPACHGHLCEVELDGVKHKKQFLPKELFNLLIQDQAGQNGGKANFKLASTLPSDGVYDILHTDYNNCFEMKTIKIKNGMYQIWDKDRSDTGWGPRTGMWTQARSLSRIGKWTKYIFATRSHTK